MFYCFVVKCLVNKKEKEKDKGKYGMFSVKQALDVEKVCSFFKFNHGKLFLSYPSLKFFQRSSSKLC